MLIRTEAPADILVVDQLLKSVFDTEAEANLVMALRENGNRTLSLVACEDDGEVVGFAMFSPVSLAGEHLNWQGLASLGELGYPACVVLGNPDYYQRFGFKPANQFGFTCQWEVPADAFQIVALWENELDNRQGLIEYCPEFNELA